MKPFLKVVKDSTKHLKSAIKALQQKETLVGIPSTTDKRTDENGEITNAALLYIHEHGSDIQNIPARPVLAIGIRNAQEAIALEYAKLAKAVLTKGGNAYDTYYERVGMIASQSVKKVFNEQDGLEPLAESTLEQRKREGFNGDKALIRTGQLRNAITYVVRNKKWRK